MMCECAIDLKNLLIKHMKPCVILLSNYSGRGNGPGIDFKLKATIFYFLVLLRI